MNQEPFYLYQTMSFEGKYTKTEYKRNMDFFLINLQQL